MTNSTGKSTENALKKVEMNMILVLLCGVLSFESPPSLSRFLFDRGNDVHEEYHIVVFASSKKRYLDGYDLVKDGYWKEENL